MEALSSLDGSENQLDKFNKWEKSLEIPSTITLKIERIEILDHETNCITFLLKTYNREKCDY